MSENVKKIINWKKNHKLKIYNQIHEFLKCSSKLFYFLMFVLQYRLAEYSHEIWL